MRKESSRTDATCDQCGKTFENIKLTGCVKEDVVTSLLVGKFSEFSGWTTTKYGYDLGDVCKECQSKLFNVVKSIFPKAKWMEINND